MPREATRADPDAAPWGERLFHLLATPIGRNLLRIGAGAVILLVAGSVVRQARGQAYRLSAYRLNPASIRFVDLPSWADRPILAALNDPRRLAVSVSVFDPRAEDHVRAVLAAHPMVSEVRRISVEYPNRVTVAVRLRAPVARVQIDRAGGYELLSDDRHVLDPVPYRGYLERVRVPLPVVVGVRARAPGLGQPWLDRDEQAAEAVEAARVAARIWRDLQGRALVKTIDVSRFPARPEERADGEVRFVLADGRTVEWGRTERDPGDVGEDGYATKLRRLEAHLSDEALKSKKRIDVRYRMRFEGVATPP